MQGIKLSITPIRSDLVAYPFPAPRFFCEAWWTCQTTPGATHTYRMPFDALLALTDDISVLLPSIRHLYDVVLRPEPGWGRRKVPQWHGINCSLRRAEIWVPVRGEAPILRSFALLVRIPTTEPKYALPFILLGTQFLQEYGGKVSVDSVAGSGELTIP
jgi:hypothetical protein